MVSSASRRKEMSEGELRALLSAKIVNSLGYQGGKLAQDRIRAEKYYLGDPFGNEAEGRSQVVSRDVAEAVDSMLPALLKIFTAGAEVARFEPAKPGEDDAAGQATDYVNWIWNQQNDGFQIFHSWFKDALLKKVGTIKIWWDQSAELTKETYRGLTDAEFVSLLADADIAIVTHEEYPDPLQMAAAAPSPPVSAPPGAAVPGAIPPVEQPPSPPLLHDVVVQKANRAGRVRVAPVPPDEFLMEHRAVSLDETPFCAHRVKRTATEWKELFPDKTGLIDSAPGGEEAEYGQERLQRFKDEDELPYRQDGIMDPSMREIWGTECYVKVDFDGDGYAELRQITVLGDEANVVLENEEVEDHPFASVTPLPMPHKFYGMSVADQILDLQLIKSTIWRQSLDRLYLANAPQIGAVEGQVNLDDLLNRRPGGVVRLKNANALVPIELPAASGDPMQMIAYIDSVREGRTGVQRMAPGPDANVLRNAYADTATGINVVQTASQERLEYYARVFAETGVKRAFRRILELVCKHQNEAQTIRLRGAWVDMDPREWSTRMDMTVTVGLGTGNKQQQVQVMMALLGVDQQIIQLQGGLAGPILTAENFYNKLAKLVEAAGLKSVALYYTDPRLATGAGTPPPPPPPQPVDPNLLALQMQPQLEQMRGQIEAQKNAVSIASRERIAAMEAAQRREESLGKLALERELRYADLNLRAQQIGLTTAQAQTDAELKKYRQVTDAPVRQQDTAPPPPPQDRGSQS